MISICNFHNSYHSCIQWNRVGSGFYVYKIERVKQLIEKNRDIYTAVTECGFVDLTHLNKHFKSVYGTTAFEYMSHL